MIGLIPKLLIDMVEASVGLEGVAKVKRLASVPIDATFRMNEVYDDAQL